MALAPQSRTRPKPDLTLHPPYEGPELQPCGLSPWPYPCPPTTTNQVADSTRLYDAMPPSLKAPWDARKAEVR